MKTDQLIEALVRDAPPVVSPGRELGPRLVVALVLALVTLAELLGIRPDLRVALADPLVGLKFLFSGSLAAIAATLVVETARPETVTLRRRLWLLLPYGLLAAGVTYDLGTSPSSDWMARAIGRYPQYCVGIVPLLSLFPLAAIFLVLRHAAPTRPGVAGALAGLAGGSMAAFIYALHCPDDSAMFQLIWYSIAIGISTMVGAVAGRRLLVW
jgi:hypothetical protein